MTISVLAESLKNKIDAANPNVLADAMRIVKLGSILASLPTSLFKKVPAASSYNLATLLALGLPDDMKAGTIFSAYSRAGTVTGPLTVVGAGVTPATGEVAVAPNGEIVTLAADAITSLDVVYLPSKADIVEAELAVATNVLTIPAAYTAGGVVTLLEAEVTVGTSTGKKIVLVPAASAPAAGQAKLNVAKTTVTFAGADGATKARVKLAIAPAVDVAALLTALSTVA